MKTSFVTVKDFFDEISQKGKELQIPYYQRGYRWREAEVEALLSDINTEPNGYCLQPIVLKNLTIVDGQQRLTTITLIRKNLGVEDSVANALLKKDRNEIDSYFIEKSDKKIVNFLNSHSKAEFEEKLNNCRFIVCILDENENEEAVFMRINAGKIPLSSAEILKSYYLTEEKYKSEREIFKSKWLDIKETLQDDAFYYFFSHDDNKKSKRYYSSRMDFLLEVFLIHKALIEKEEYNWEKEFDKRYESSPIFAFTSIHEASKCINAIDLIDSLNNTLQTMKHIYNDTKLYNLYGFVSCSLKDPFVLLPEISANDPNEFFSFLTDKTKAIVGEPDKKSLEDLNYYNSNDKGKIKNILLLHNAIRSTERDIRFDYNDYRNPKTNYNLEHIHARAEIKDKKVLQDFCKEVINEYEGKKDNKCPEKFLDEFKEFCEEKFKEEDPLMQETLILWENCIWALACDGDVKERSSEDKKSSEDKSSSKDSNTFGWNYNLPNNLPKDDDPADSYSWRFKSISNLCLLPASINSGIGNLSFEKKRKYVTKEFLNGTQFPVTTAEVFNVFISNKNYPTANASVWGRSQGEKYLKDIEETIKGYLDIVKGE